MKDDNNMLGFIEPFTSILVPHGYKLWTIPTQSIPKINHQKTQSQFTYRGSKHKTWFIKIL